jgi:hypothetical protein
MSCLARDRSTSSLKALRRVYLRLPQTVQVALTAVLRRVRRFSRVKVSVIVAAYNSDQSGLDRVMSSLARQTMPARNFEVIFVDDGSTDDTRQRLDRIARRVPNVVVKSIPNSGWASRPRNVGTRIARGEFVLYMDHDDALFPHALERAYAYGRQHRADIVNAKEVRSTGWSWGWESFRADVPVADQADVMALIPMTPHKLYRRSFVLRTGVRFPEGERALWEDIHFNTALLAHRPRLAVLAHTPFYHWVVTGANTSGTFGRNFAELWANVAGLFDLCERELADHPARWPLVAHTLRGRVLRTVGPPSLSRSAAYLEVMYPAVQRIVAAHAPPERDGDFSPVDRCRLELIRVGDAALQRVLAKFDDGVTTTPVVDTVRWEGAELVLTASATLVDSEGAPLRVRRDGDRWHRELPDEVAARLSQPAMEVTASLDAATFDITVKGRASRSTWRVPGAGRVECVEDGTGVGVITASATARFDPNEFAAAHDLNDPVWEFAGRLAAMGYVSHRGLRGGRAVVALLNGVQAIGYENKSGLYSLDVAADVRSVTGSAPPDPSDTTIEVLSRMNGTATVAVTMPLRAVHCAGTTRLEGAVWLGDRKVPATLTGANGDAALRFTADVPDGDFPLRSEFLGRKGTIGVVLSVSEGHARIVAA